MLDPLAPEIYHNALYGHMYRIVPLLERIDEEMEIAVTKSSQDIIKRLKAMRTITVFGLFDAEFYNATYRDVPASEFEALEHYVSHGEAAGYKPNVVFSPSYYHRQASAGAAEWGNALEHYCDTGERLGQKASLGFDPRAYLEANPSLADFVDRPLFHFLKVGLPAGLPMRPTPTIIAQGSPDTCDSSVEPCDKAHWRRLKHELEQLERRAAPKSVGRNLVMGLAINYRKTDLAPFIFSLRDCGYSGKILLWVSELDSETHDFLEEQRVDYEYYWEMHFSPFNFMLARNFSYYGYLCSLANHNQFFDRILLTDVADVLFQADPFASAPDGDIVVFLEDKVRTLDSCNINGYWIRSAFGDHVFREVRGRRISCAGTVLGTWNGMLRYLLAMQLGAFECSVSARLLEGIDQAIHNVMFYRSRLSGAVAIENAKHVFTMGILPKSNVVITREGKITDSNGRICPIVHQYNRHPAVTKLIRERYVHRYDAAHV
jgi:hypothetical protein